MEEPEVTRLQDIVNKSWHILRVSPLYKFQVSESTFQEYAHSLEVHISSEVSNGRFSRPPEVNIFIFGDETTDGSHIGIHASIPQEDDKKVDFLLLLYHYAYSKKGEESAKRKNSDFASYPLALSRGNGNLKKSVFSWLERQFDCKIIPLSLPSHSLRDLAMKWLDQIEENYLKTRRNDDSHSMEDSTSHSPAENEEAAKPLELIFQFLEPVAPNLTNLALSLPHKSLLNLLETRHETETEDDAEREEPKGTFIDVIYTHFQNNMFIDLKYSPVGTSWHVNRARGRRKAENFYEPQKSIRRCDF
eukprot:Phypoly_transcript_15048.p1 GENE.Phypoly_transcript_15048~~Phypoly_transcript_15048.p1  ORF type:complete len:316 (+),score=36.75 Phypoly_transcript_15048:39-950(+)